MEKFYDDANAFHVRNYVIYGDGTTAYAYEDSDCEKKLSKEDLEKAFYVGAIINVDGVIYKPLAFSKNSVGGYASVTYAVADSSTATTAVLTVLNSKEYTVSG